MQRPADLPKFDRPPIDEVAVGVYFSLISGFGDLGPVLIWERLKDEYPQLSSQPRLELTEPEPNLPLALMPQSPVFQLMASPPPRTWLTSSDERDVIQIQNDLLLANWRKRKGSSYPQLEAVVRRWRKAFETYGDVAEAQGWDRPLPKVVELTYINIIDDLEPVDFLRYAAMTHLEHVSDGDAEVQAWTARYRLRDRASGYIGRLSVEYQKVLRPNNGGWVAPHQLSFVSRMALSGAATEHDILQRIADCRQAIVWAFTDLTTPKAHEHWGRVQ